MSISLDKRWQLFVKEQVEQGRYRTEAEVVEDGLRLIAEREAKRAALRQSLNDAIERGGENASDAVVDRLRAKAEQLKTKGG
ncbi:MAG: type II toxin-antitoxin system ParD family antitoxin [Maricaulis sp.]|nr:type II toxin-antitoxin system ParD family antitoxin [Maricaulis sp.]|tara:strand:- start:126 stop:371 length:246 start_codon:yes stop_codon:yes gene_type:complete